MRTPNSSSRSNSTVGDGSSNHLQVVPVQILRRIRGAPLPKIRSAPLIRRPHKSNSNKTKASSDKEKSQGEIEKGTKLTLKSSLIAVQRSLTSLAEGGLQVAEGFGTFFIIGVVLVLIFLLSYHSALLHLLEIIMKNIDLNYSFRLKPNEA